MPARSVSLPYDRRCNRQGDYVPCYNHPMKKRVHLNPQEQLELRLPGRGEKFIEGALEMIVDLSPGVSLMSPEIERIVRKLLRAVYGDAHDEAYETFSGPLENAVNGQRTHMIVKECSDPNFDKNIEPLEQFLKDCAVPSWAK